MAISMDLLRRFDWSTVEVVVRLPVSSHEFTKVVKNDFLPAFDDTEII